MFNLYTDETSMQHDFAAKWTSFSAQDDLSCSSKKTRDFLFLAPIWI